jgi:amino acid permease
MFSTGQLIFAGIFLIAFILVISRSYKKDAILHKKHYKGSFYVLLGFIAFIGLLFFIKTVLYH